MAKSKLSYKNIRATYFARIKKWVIDELPMSTICDNLGISKATMSRWRKAHPEFNELFIIEIKSTPNIAMFPNTKKEVIEALLATAMELASGNAVETTTKTRYDKNEVVIFSEVTEKRPLPNLGMLQFLLSNVDNDAYRRTDRPAAEEIEVLKDTDDSVRESLLLDLQKEKPGFFTEAPDEEE